MTHLDINPIVARHFGITPDCLMHSVKYVDGSYPRGVAMLICKAVLKASTIKLACWYGKHQHTTPMRAMRTAKNLIRTDPEFEKKYKASLVEVKALYKLMQLKHKALEIAELEKKNIKQIYNLNHRVREKGIVVRTRSRTLSCSEEQLNDLNDIQLKKLLDTHHYAIQLSIL